VKLNLLPQIHVLSASHTQVTLLGQNNYLCFLLNGLLNTPCFCVNRDAESIGIV